MKQSQKFNPWEDPWTGFDGRGKKNRYTCEKCGCSIITEDIDAGVTPAFMACRATAGCDGMMGSSFYTTATSIDADGEWYRPSPEATVQLGEAVQDHVTNGGLLLRRKATGRAWVVPR